MDIMDVIDLCDDDDDQPSVQSNSPALVTNIIKSENDAESNQVPKVPPIRVVNLASLQTVPRVVNVDPTKESRPNRRKSVHQTLLNDNDAVVVAPATNTTTAHKIRIVRNVSNTMPAASSSPSTPRTSTFNTKPQIRSEIAAGNLQRRKTVPRRNDELMKRVAFLRVCAEYMLRDLNLPNVLLGEDPSLNVLMAQYASAKPKKPSIIKST